MTSGPPVPPPPSGRPSAGAALPPPSGPAIPGAPPSTPRRHPRNPWIGLYFALLFLLPAIVGAAALVDQFFRVISFDIAGQGTETFILFGPPMFAALGVIAAVRAFGAFRPWAHYRATTALAQRRADRALDLVGQVRWPLVMFGILAFAGSGFLLLARPNNLAGSLLLWEFQMLLLLAWTATLGLVAQKSYYARYLPAAVPDIRSVGDVTPGNPARDTL